MEPLDFQFKPEDALLIVDPQLDFMPEGSLAVTEGDLIIPMVNQLIKLANSKAIPIFVSRDWHPEAHCSFHSQGGPWPVHCVQHTKGAEFHPDLQLPQSAVIINKAFEQNQEGYSSFSGEDQKGRDLSCLLRAKNVKRVVICGLALDYCVYATAVDANKNHFDFLVLEQACRAIDQQNAAQKMAHLHNLSQKD